MIGVKDLVIIGVAVAITAWLLTPHAPVSLPYLAPGQHSDVWRHGPGERIGARNHSGIEPYDLFGLRGSEQGRDDDGGRDLPDEGR